MFPYKSAETASLFLLTAINCLTLTSFSAYCDTLNWEVLISFYATALSLVPTHFHIGEPKTKVFSSNSTLHLKGIKMHVNILNAVAFTEV